MSETLPSAGVDFKVSTEHEQQIANAVALAYKEIEASMILAQQFPRNYNDVWGAVMKVCERRTLAEKATYSYPRGGSTISGPSVYLARAIFQNYKHLRIGLNILRDDESTRTIQGYCWDVQMGSKSEFSDTFQKLIYRKQGGWIKPDERDLRELTMRRGAILIRTAIFHIIPSDIIEDAIVKCRATLKSAIKDPRSEAKNLILDFDRYGVTAAMLSSYIGTENWCADDIVELSGILNALRDGTAKRDDYFSSAPEPANGKLNMDNLHPADPATHQGYEPPKGQLL